MIVKDTAALGELRHIAGCGVRNIRIDNQRFRDIGVIGPCVGIIVRECVSIIEDAHTVDQDSDGAGGAEVVQ